MRQACLSETLVSFLEALDTTQGSGLVVDTAEVNAPLELRLQEVDGQLVVYAQPPVSVWHSGFEMPVHKTTMIAVSLDQVSMGSMSDDRVTSGDADAKSG